MTPITHPLLDRPGLHHGFFTREGGVSTGIYAGLNTGVGSQDDPAAVAENRRRVAAAFDRPLGDLSGCYQVHSDIAHVVEAPWNGERPQGDAVVTRTPGRLCSVLTADCAPVLLADAEAGVVAAAHAGWKGAVGGILDATVATMQTLGARPERTVAVVGPCIAPRSYEVGDDFRARFVEDSPDNARFFTAGRTLDRHQFDLPAYVLSRLDGLGLAETAWTGQDTAADPGRFFSNRRAHLSAEPDFGRMISVITLKP